MKNLYKIALTIFVGVLCMANNSLGQISQGGTPYSFSNTVQAKNSLAPINLIKPNLLSIKAQDAINDISKENYRVGINVPVNYTVNNSGTWETTPDGGNLWRLRLHMDDALALALYYNNFYIPTGGKVFIYNEGENHVIGAFTEANNFQNQIRATQMIQGETITIEYYAPSYVTQPPAIEIKEVVYMYRGVEDFIKPIAEEAGESISALEKAQSCQVDVACTPESNGWSEQIDATVHYTFSQGASTFVCSASMVNNTSQDCTPYILSAWHCGEPNAGSNIGTWTWYWNYQKTTCSTGAANGSDPGKGTDTMTGGTVVASSGNGTLNNPPGTNQLAGSDFYLVELTSQPPVGYNAYYAGWDRTNNAAASGVGIHHPAGSAKKISTYNSNLLSTSYNGGPANTHWRVTWISTTNGHGVTEGGSSGSPIFDDQGRVVGQLSGGSSFCNTPTSPDLYGKMFTNWDLNGTANNARLAPWLDPGNTGATVLDGTYQPCSSTNPPTCGITASATSTTAGGSITYTDGSTGVPTSWSWDFDNTSIGGASPSTSTVQNPGSVTFSNVGTYEVELTATNANGSCTTTQLITVTASAGCDTLLNIADTNSLTIYGAQAGGYITGTNGYGDLAKVEKYSNYNPYTHVTGADIFFFGVDDGGIGSTVTLNIYDDNAGLPNTVVGSVTYNLSTISNALATNNGQGVLFLPFNAPVNVAGNDFYIGLDLSDCDMAQGDTVGIVSKLASVNTPPNSAYEQWSDGTWHDMETAWNGNPFSLYITARVTDNPVTGSVTATPLTACTGSPINLSATSSNATSFDWFMTGGTPNSATTQNATVTYSTAGTYTIYALINGDCSGQYLDSVQVTVSDGPTINSTGTDPSCAGNDGQIVIGATGGTPNYTYTINGGTPQSSDTFGSLADGTYTVAVIDGNGCSASETITLAPNAGSITVSSTTSNPSCGASDGSITVTATGGTGYMYSVNGGTPQSSNVFNNLPAGVYNITVTDNGGCTGTDAATLTNPGAPTASATGTDLSCNGAGDGSATITATGGAGSYTYSVDNINFVSNNTFTGLSAGTTTLYVQDANGCSASTTVTINEPTAVTHTVNITDASCGNNNGAISVTAAGGAGSYTYVLDGGTPQNNGVFTGLTGGTYTVQVFDGNSCSSIISTESITGGGNVSITVNSTNESCLDANGAINISATGGSPSYTYSIDGGMTSQPTGNFSNLAAGSYNILVTDNAGCTASSTANLTNSGGFNLQVLGGQSICSGNSATISASGAGAGATYTWDNGLGTGAGQMVSPTVTTTYTCTASDMSGCTESGAVTITVDTPPTVTVTATDDTICSGSSVTLLANGASSYFWNDGSTTASITDSPTAQTTYSVIGANGACNGSPVSTVVYVENTPTVVAGSDVINIPIGGTVNFNNIGSSANSYSWNFGDGTNSTQGFVSHQYFVAGSYTVTLTGATGNCTATDQLIINVGVSDINEIDLESMVSLYPNPNNGVFTLSVDLPMNRDVKTEVFSAIGKMIKVEQFRNISHTVLTYDLSNNAEGIYLVRITVDGKTITKRINVIK